MSVGSGTRLNARPTSRAGRDAVRSPAVRILMTTDTVGGVWGYAVQLARAVAPHADVTLAALGVVSADQRTDAAGLPLVAAEYKLEWMADPWADVAASGAWLLELERDLRPDVVHLNGYAHARQPFRGPTVIVGHSCVGSWWQAVHGQPPPPTWDRYTAEVRAGWHAATAVVAPTRAILAELTRLYGDRLDAHVIRNGRSADDFAPAVKQPFVLSAGRLWDEAKNLATLDRAAAVGLPWPVKVAGDGGGGGGAVELLGKLDAAAMARQFAAASVYCLPARYEPFGLSVLEAALSGCALVLGDIPTLRELWDGAAVFVPPTDVAALHGALARLMAEPDRRADLARRGRDRAMHYGVAPMSAAYLGLYRRLAGVVEPAPV